MKNDPLPNIANTYLTGNGHELLNPHNWPKAVKQYLETQTEIFTAITKNKYKLILEIGCFDGTYLQWAKKFHKRYVGIDIATDWLKLGEHRAQLLKSAPDTYEFLNMDALHLEKIFQKSKLIRKVDPRHIIAILPFNVIGNIHDPGKVIRGLRALSVDYFISSFSTTKEATTARHEYYANCDYPGLTRSTSDLGVTFTSVRGGFSSIAFDENFYLSASHNASDHILKYFGGVGIGCFSVRGLNLTEITNLLIN